MKNLILISSINYYHYDGLGTTRQLTDDTETIVASYTYDAFGNLIASTGATTNAYGFTGEQQFGEADNLVFLRARYYDSRVGRFISRDPILQPIKIGNNFFWPLPSFLDSPQELNPYVYCFNNPGNWIDPHGKAGIPLPPWMGGITVFTCAGCLGCLAGTEIGCIGAPSWDQCVRDTLKDYRDDFQRVSNNPECATAEDVHSLACIVFCAACIPNLYPTGW